MNLHKECNGAKVVVDLAFALKEYKDSLIKSSQRDPDQPHLIILNRDATSLRQMSEWGMRMFQGQLPRIKDRMCLEEYGERRITMNLPINLYNFQCSTIGHNQILLTFMRTSPATDMTIPYEELRNDLVGRYFHVGRRLSVDGNGVFQG